MTRRAIAGALAASLALIAMPAAAKDKVSFQKTSAVKDAPVFTPDPAQAYILVRSDAATPLLLMRDPGDEDDVAYRRLRAEALAEAREKYARKLASYERAVAAAAKAPKGSPAVSVPEKPIEPTESNFEFTPFGLLTAVPIGPLYRFAKQDGGGSTYLQAVTPGSYRIYGPLAVTPGSPPFGTCFCMGSVRFDARAGEIVDMGTVVTKERAVDKEAPMPTGYFQLTPATADTPLDARLKEVTVVPARYRPAGKLPNYYGVTIDRIPAMPGVLRYERDRVIDLTGG